MKKREEVSTNVQAQSDHQCAWVASGERCRYPGSISAQTNGGGPWYCSLHFGCDSGIAGHDIVLASRSYRPLRPDEISKEFQLVVQADLAVRKLKGTRNEAIAALHKFLPS